MVVAPALQLGVRRVVVILVHAPLLDIGEERGERIEVAHRERVVLVVVALAAAHGRAEPGIGHGPHAVTGILGQILAGLCAALSRHHVQAVEASRHKLLGGRVGKQVAGELLDGELVEGLVAVERVDHIVAVRENVAGPGRRGIPPCRRTVPGPATERPSARRSGVNRGAGRPGAHRRGGRHRARMRGPLRASGAGRSGQAMRRRISVCRSASGDGAMPLDSSLLRMNASMGLRTHDTFFTMGIAVREGGT